MTWLFWTSYAALWVTVCILSGAMVVMLREHADIMLGSREGRSRLHGPPEGATVPPLGGEEIRLAAGAPARPRTIIFMAVACQPCRQRRLEISHFATDHAESVETVVCCSGPVDGVHEFARDLGPDVSVVADPTGDASAEWRVFMTPFAIGVDPSGVVRGKVANPSYDTLTLLSRLVVRESIAAVRT